MRAIQRPFSHATIRRIPVLFVATLAFVAACASPAPAETPTPAPAAAVPTSAPTASASDATAQTTSAVIYLKTADEFERLKGQGQPVLLAILDESLGNKYPDSSGCGCSSLDSLVGKAAETYQGKVRVASIDVSEPAGAELGQKYGTGPKSMILVFFTRDGTIDVQAPTLTEEEAGLILDRLLR